MWVFWCNLGPRGWEQLLGPQSHSFGSSVQWFDPGILGWPGLREMRRCLRKRRCRRREAFDLGKVVSESWSQNGTDQTLCSELHIHCERLDFVWSIWKIDFWQLLAILLFHFWKPLLMIMKIPNFFLLILIKKSYFQFLKAVKK